MTDVVLIHSTGQSAAGWERLVPELAARGAAAHAIDLPNDQPELRAADYARIVAAAVPGVQRPMVVAHSGSGPLLPALTESLDASRQVWLTAWVPDRGASVLDDMRAHLDEAFDPGWVGRDAVTDDAVALEFVYHDCDDEAAAWALTTRRTFVPSAVYDERIAVDTGVPTSYVLATDDRTILPAWQRRMARERLGVEPVEIASGHCPNVSRPAELAEILLSLR